MAIDFERYPDGYAQLKLHIDGREPVTISQFLDPDEIATRRFDVSAADVAAYDDRFGATIVRELYRHLEKVYDERVGEPHGTEARRSGSTRSE